jgi:hypothetical protein
MAAAILWAKRFSTIEAGSSNYLGTDHDFSDVTASFTFLATASRFTSRIAFAIAARICGSVGEVTLR